MYALPELTVCFIWHMHQPDYKDNVSGRYLMPWVRLHAVKDYLDMVMMLSEHPTIHQTFNLVPSLLQQIEDYANPGVLDYHQELTLLKGDYSDDQKRFILERFFDANPHHMIGKFPEYKRLYEKRQGLKSLEDGISLFSDGELSDITAFFNLCWFDPMWMNSRPELKALGQKHRGFTWDEKALILEIQRELVAQVIPTYKKFQDSGHIEITTTPYYHPILPLLIDSDSAKIGRPGAHLPKNRFQSEADARVHLERSVAQYHRLFGKAPKGIWPSEQSISPEAVKLFNEYGFSWAVSSEGNLARSLGIYWDKDAYGHYRNIHELASAYSYEGVNLLFRNLTLSDNIGFTYASMPPEEAAQDCYQRLKQIQQQMLLHPDVHAPVVTIALDGENCWESYQEDGAPFLHALYTLLENDNTLKARTVQEYFEVACPAHAILPLKNLHSGSWIESDFHIWIGDSLKNSAWDLLSQTREDLVRWQADNLNHLHLDKAWEEIYIAEGSDWFWWYGEPHNSGQDDQFDMQFRLHLKNVYHLMGAQYPDALDIPLSSVNGKHVKGPTQLIQPTIDGVISSRDEWAGSGRFDLAKGEGAMHRGDRLVTCVYYGSSEDWLYLRFDFQHDLLKPNHRLAIYLCSLGKTRYNSPIRLKVRPSLWVPTQSYLYAYELEIKYLQSANPKVICAEAIKDHLWIDRPDIPVSLAMKEVLELAVPLDYLDTYPGDSLGIAFATADEEVVMDFVPPFELLPLTRGFISQKTPPSTGVSGGVLKI